MNVLRAGCVAAGVLLGGIAGYHYVGIAEDVRHMIEGGVVGGALLLIASQFFASKTQLVWKKLKIEVPLVGEAEFEVEGAESRTFALVERQREVGWRIYVQLVTRVSVQKIEKEHGSLRGSLTSLHDLMQAVRGELGALPPAAVPDDPNESTIETLAAWVLNAIRALLAKWHQSLKDYETAKGSELNFPGTEACYADLEQLQKTLRLYATSLGQLLEVQPPSAFAPPKKK